MPAKPLTDEQRLDAQRLTEAFELRKMIDPSLTQNSLALDLGWKSQSSVSQYLQGRIPLNLEALIKFSRALRAPPDTISPTLARKLLSAKAVQAGPPDLAGYDNVSEVARGARVPVISWVSAGTWTEAQDPYAVGDAEEWVACNVAHGPRTFVLRVRGVSMENPHGRPSFSEGDLIYVDPDREALHKSLVIAKLDREQEVTFKQLLIEGGRQYLRALNPSWPEPIIELKEGSTIVGVAIFKGEAL